MTNKLFGNADVKKEVIKSFKNMQYFNTSQAFKFRICTNHSTKFKFASVIDHHHHTFISPDTGKEIKSHCKNERIANIQNQARRHRRIRSFLVKMPPDMK